MVVSIGTDILAEIRSSGPRLGAAEKRVAAVVLNNPDRAMRSSITELAEMAGTSEPTVLRLCRKIGLSGYMELRLCLASTLPSSGYILENVTASDSLPDIFNKIMHSAKEALNATLNRLDLNLLEAAAQALAAAERIEFYGVGGSGVIARDAQHKFFRLGVPCFVYDDPHMQVMSAALLSDTAVVVAISHSGATKDILETTAVARSAGARVIAITGEKKCPLARHCDIAISVDSTEVALRLAPMTSRLVMLAVIDVLFVSTAMRHFNDVRGRLDKVKHALVDKRY